MSLPVPINLQSGQIALDPINGVVYYKDEENNLVATTWSWLRNNESSISTDDNVLIDSDLTISGNLVVEGDTVSLNVAELLIEDNILILNANFVGSPILNAGIEVERGDEPNTSIRWNEDVNSWQFTNDGINYFEVNSIIEDSVTLGFHTVGDYVKNLTAGTGVTILSGSGEGATPTISIGQDVSVGATPTFSRVLTNLTGDVTGDLTGNVTGDVSGNLTGDVSGNVTGDLTGDVTGDLTGNVTGDVTGNVTGDLTGDVTGDVTGDLTGNVTGDVTGDLTGNVTGQVSDIGNHGITDLSDVTINDALDGDFLRWTGSAWVNDAVNLTTDTVGDYVSTVTDGLGILVTNTGGEGATPNIAIDTSIVQTRVANITDTEIGYLDGVTSGVQAQLNSKQPTFTGYDYEIHVSQVDGNDTTGNGDLLTPVASITKALTLVTSQRKTVIIHPGTYTESPSITTQYTTLTGPGLIGGNIVISGTVSTNTGCTISGIKMTNLTVSTPTAQGNVNILNCEVSGTFTKSSNADYTVARLCDFGAVSITGAGLVAIFGGNPNFVTVNNASANVIVKSAVAVAPVLTAGTLALVDSVVPAAVTNAVTSAASSVITLANCQLLTSALNSVAPVVLNGFYSILNCVYDKPSSTLVATSGTGGSTNSIDYFQYINAEKFITQGGTSSQYVKGDGSLDSIAYAPLATPTFTGMATIPQITVGGIEIDTTSPADTNVLKYSSSLNKYIPGVASTVASLDDLTDVIISGATPNQVLVYQEDGTWTAADAPIPSVEGSAYFSTIGDGIETTFTIAHNLGTRDIFISTRDALEPYSSFITSWDAIDSNNIILYFENPPALGSVRVSIYAALAGSSFPDLEGTTFVGRFGDGEATVIPVIHDLGTRNVFIQVRNAESPYELLNVAWESTSTNITTFYFDSAPDEDSIQILIYSSVIGVPTTSLSGLTDVNYVDPEDRDILSWDEASSRWIPQAFLTSVSLSLYGLNDISDVEAESATPGEYLKFDGEVWVNDTIDLGTDTNGSYVKNLVAGTGINITNNSGEGATPNIEVSSIVVKTTDTAVVTETMLATGVARSGFRSTLNAQTGTSYTLVLTDLAKLVTLSNTSAITLTIPLESSVAFLIGDRIDILQTNTGQVTIVGAAGVTVNATPGLKLRSRWSSATLVKLDTNSWVIIGDMQA
jgi:hypothetical protein